MIDKRKEYSERWKNKIGIEEYRRRARVSAQQWRDNNKEKSRQIKRKSDEKNKIKIRERRRIWARELKIDVLRHYSNGTLTCVFCGEDRLACLSIDHIDGNGCKDRKESNKNGTRMYQWLKTNNYPEGYQTLCMNCQFIKREGNKEFRYAID
jgi:hypothetical protein